MRRDVTLDDVFLDALDRSSAVERAAASRAAAATRALTLVLDGLVSRPASRHITRPAPPESALHNALRGHRPGSAASRSLTVMQWSRRVGDAVRQIFGGR